MMRTVSIVILLFAFSLSFHSSSAESFSVAGALQVQERGEGFVGDRKLLARSNSRSRARLSAGSGGRRTRRSRDEQSNSSQFTVTNSATCTAKASSNAVEFEINRIIDSSASAIARVCNSGDSVMFMFRFIFRDVAQSLARAIANAQIKCKSTGQAYACGKAESSARAWASSNGQAFASAFSEAIRSCGPCRASRTRARAFAKTLVNLIAKASAQASASACVRGNQAVSVNAWTDCFARAFAFLTTESVASAFARGKCGDDEAKSFVKAFTNADISLNTVCTSNVAVQGSGSGSGSSSGSSNSVLLPLLVFPSELIQF